MSDADHQSLKTSATVNHVALVAGSKIGRYQIIGVLGQGGFGITYRARDTQLNRDVAIKEYLPTVLAIRQNGSTVLPLSTAVADDFIWGRERFIEEGRTLASLHEAPAIVRVFDYLEENGTAYIVMELLRGQTLERKLRRGPLSHAEVHAILRPLLDGLQYVHEAGFLHRDIKPANILLNAAGRPTLIDFGAARAAMLGRTTQLTAILTPGYAAPEQFSSAKQGPWTDIYGLSATLHCAITKQAPPRAFDRVLQDTYQPLAQRSLRGFPRELLAGLDSGLAVHAADRPQSITAWRSLLDGGSTLREQATVPTPQPHDQSALRVAAVDVRPTKPVPSRRVALYLGIIVVVGALAAGGTFALRPGPVTDVGLRDAKVEDLEKALEARRKVDPTAAEKRRLEEETQRKAAEQKAQADAAARQAAIEEARRKVEAEAAVRRQAEDEAWRKALVEAETALRRQVEDDARRKAAAEAEAKRQADEALAKAQADRQRADEEANRKAQAEASVKADADARKAGELAENGLRLTVADRQRLQVALTSLGFDTRGYDGAFGPRTRDMIAGWQKARNLPPTGFLTASQRQALLREAAAALTKYDDEQKKFEDDRRKADEARRRGAEEARPTSSTPLDAPMALPPDPPAPPPPPFAAATGSSFDGTYRGSLMVSITSTSSVTASLELRNGRLSGSLLDNRCGTYGFAATVSPSGEIRGTLPFMADQICSPGQATASGRIVGNQLQLEIRVGPLSATGSLVRSGG